MHNKAIRIGERNNSWFVALAIIITVCLGACSPKHSSFSEFSQLDGDVWYANEPIKFSLDRTNKESNYDFYIAFYFDNTYKYQNVSVIIDYMKDNKKLATRHIQTNVTDKYGNWVASGFGNAYQYMVDVDKSIPATRFDKIIVWHNMSCDTLQGITGVGLVAKQK